MEVIFHEMEGTSVMQRVNALKQPDPHQHYNHPHPEYTEKDTHKVIVTSTSDSDGANLMKVKSNISGRVYSIHLEFTGDATGMGEEIKNNLKQKYIQQEWESGSLQTDLDALQSPSQEGEREGQGA